MEKLFDVEASAQMLGGVSPWTIRAWLSEGKLQPTKVGRRTMIRESELERFLQAEQQAAGRKRGRLDQ
jgi:excisionase family DNA binding protein